MKKNLFIIALTLSSIWASAQTFNVILGRPTNQSISMNILFDQQVVMYVEYGNQAGSYTNTTSSLTSILGQPIELSISGLSSETTYFYRIRYRIPTITEFSTSPEYHFITQRKKSSSFSFSIEADPHPYDKKGYHPLWDIALNNMLTEGSDFLIDLGDTFGDDHTATTITSSEIKQLILDNRPHFGAVCHSMPFFFCQGNHEGESGYYLLQTPPNNLATYETLWRKTYYPNPYPDGFYTGNQEEEGNGIGKPENYYAWEWGDALFVVVDGFRYYTTSAKPRGWEWTIGKTQYEWLKQTLENSNAKYKFVFTHHILGETRGGEAVANLCEWGGYDQKGVYTFDTNRPGWGKPIQQLMEDNNVTIFFQGHDHLYAKEQVGSVIYQTVPMPSDSTYVIGMTDNGDAFPDATKFQGAGHLNVCVGENGVKVDFVAAVLPQDETNSLHNGDIVYSYTVGNTTGIRNIVQNSDWQLFPNPGEGPLNIYFTDDINDNLLVTISDLNGKIVAQTSENSIHATGHTLHMDNHIAKLKSGFYIISLRSGSTNYGCKLWIKK